MKLVKPLEIFKSELNSIESPSRYIGGEKGIIVKPHADDEKMFNYAIAFPDVYEIAMSNLAVRIIYNGLNSIDGVRCERVFAPGTDFEKLLKEKKVPLYTLETGMPLCETDMVGFSIGYELGITEVLAMLETGGIPLLASERKETDPIIMAGGCGVTNPLPFSLFFDAVFIGEAEDGLFDTVKELKDLKNRGASRKEKLDLIKEKSFFWMPGKEKTAFRAVQGNFGKVPSVPSCFPLPSSKPVQNHGVVEIMRGCPNGCRFCHAGIYYRPSRIKDIKYIIEETDRLIFECGYNEISLNSLSSADFPDVAGLLDLLNERYRGMNVSFQLPSLKVNSMSLDLLEKLSTVRKSGLTFAVETPDELWQLSLNKEVYAQHLEEVILEAKRRGWSSAKFYFMVGLPLGDYFGGTDEKKEEEVITDFLLELQAKTRIQCNVNVGVFIPKPHTAYQWVRQITPEKAEEKIEYIKSRLPRGKFKMGRHNFSATTLEGLLSRGDERASKVILSAYKKGVRFDAWDDKLKENFHLWEEAFNEADYDVKGWIYRQWSTEEKLPWEKVSLGVPTAFFKKEWQKSQEHLLTQKCTPDCTHRCGICNGKDVAVRKPEDKESVLNSIKNNTITPPERRPECNIPVLYRVIFSFTRTDGGEYSAYLSQLDIFYRALVMSRLPVVFSSGFNPLPRLEFVSPMSIGITSLEEIASCCLYEDTSKESFIKALNDSLPSLFKVTDAFIFPVTNMRKRESLAQSLWGAEYEYTFKNERNAALLVQDKDFMALFNNNDNSFEQSGCKLKLRVSPSDKKVRSIYEEKTGHKWYEDFFVTKTKTLSNNKVTGWTAEDEIKWRTHSSDPETVKETTDELKTEPCSYFELYKKIAEINLKLMEARKSFRE